METVDDIYELLGGPAAVGRLIGKSTEHAATMRRRGSIPVEYWPDILEGLKAKGRDSTADDLLRCHTPKVAA